MNESDVSRAIESADAAAQEALFDIAGESKQKAKPIFIVCAPRVGSTLLYQAMVNVFGLQYFSNATNDLFSKFPIVGIAREKQGLGNKFLLSYLSQYGKTVGLRETSEASAIFGNWFGGGHPSELLSHSVVTPEAEVHMRKTMDAARVITKRDLVSKNPWNSFRIRNLAAIFPEAMFIWIRRSIDAAAVSDYENRVARGNPETVWNSATTANYLEIQREPAHRQVALQQYHYSISIANALSGVSQAQKLEVWYEDLCSNPQTQFQKIYELLKSHGVAIEQPNYEPLATIKPSLGAGRKLPQDYQQIVDEISQSEKLKAMMFHSS